MSGDFEEGSSDVVVMHGGFDGFPGASVSAGDLFDGDAAEECAPECFPVAELRVVAPYHVSILRPG